MNVTDEMVEAGCAAVLKLGGEAWPIDCDDEEQKTARENIRVALEAALLCAFEQVGNQHRTLMPTPTVEKVETPAQGNPAPETHTVTPIDRLEDIAKAQKAYHDQKQQEFPTVEDFLDDDGELHLPADIGPLLSQSSYNGRYSEADWWLSTIQKVKAEASAAPPENQMTGVDEAATKAAFSHGYLLACCNVANLHGHPEIAFDILSELGISKAEVEAMDLCDYDLDALKEIETARGNKSLYRDATTEGQP